MSTIFNVKNSNSTNANDIPVKPLKFVIYLLARILVYIFINAIETSTFPAQKQKAKANALQKGGDLKKTLLMAQHY